MLAINSMLSSSRGPCRWILLVVCKACKLEVNCSTAMRLIRIYARFVFKLADGVFPPSCLHDCFTMLYLHRVFCRHLVCGIGGVCQQPGISSLLFHSFGERNKPQAVHFCSVLYSCSKFKMLLTYNFDQALATQQLMQKVPDSSWCRNTEPDVDSKEIGLRPNREVSEASNIQKDTLRCSSGWSQDVAGAAADLVRVTYQNIHALSCGTVYHRQKYRNMMKYECLIVEHMVRASRVSRN